MGGDALGYTTIIRRRFSRESRRLREVTATLEALAGTLNNATLSPAFPVRGLDTGIGEIHSLFFPSALEKK